ncbi:hypothetical protein GQ600_21938 [Phytophthora cactorum]|nr:hypothetical protein GQ600_21938 [Phytophthora cactorum]
MNGQYMFDPITGYSRETTTQLEKQGVIAQSFGTQLQFKDTPACHKLVWNFHCLSWVATTFQRNVADKCVYSHFYRMYLDEVCGNIGCLTETQEAKNSAETTCVSGSWVYAENKTFSRCSTRTYEPPAAVATRAIICKTVVAVGVLSVLWLM